MGFWRLKEVLDRRGIRATLSLNASVCEEHPRIVEESVRSRWEMMGHAYIQRVLHLEEDERAVIRKTAEVIQRATGRRPRGWLSPGLCETVNTPDILAEEGYEYVADWVNDDQPYLMRVKNGTLVSLPYTVELNDIPIYLIQHHCSPELYERGRDQFDTLYREGARSARVMAIAVHPYITGVPHRIKYFEMLLDYIQSHHGVLLWTGEEILDWYLEAIGKKGAR